LLKPPDTFLIVALSGRSLAAAVQKAGYASIVLDLFGDSDTNAIAEKLSRIDTDANGGFNATSLLDAAHRLAPSHAPLVYGAGFENHPDLLAELATAGRPLLGNSVAALAALKDPARFFPLLKRLSVPHPETSLTAPTDPTNWLTKPIGGSGGVGIQKASEGCPSDGTVFFQRQVSGTPLSLLFLANGRDIYPLAFSEQWTAPCPAHPFRFGGAIGPVTPPPGPAKILIEAAHGLTFETGLVGLNSLDALIDEAGNCYIIEINPRPGATLDLFDPLSATPLFELHLNAVAGHLPGGATPISPTAPTHGVQILYADAPFLFPEAFTWPDWTADRPKAGTAVALQAPICTIFAQGTSVFDARAVIDRRTGTLRDQLARCKGSSA
jgi:uncharacterized protein